MKKIKVLIGSLIGILAVCSMAFAAVSGEITNEVGFINTGTESARPAVDPTASLAAGTYTSSQSVTLSASGADSIRYTVDGSTPTCNSGLVYSSAITVASTKTIKAISCYSEASGSVSFSNVSAFAYVINIPSSSGGGGGGGGSVSYCSAVTYGDWQTTCFGNVQYRNVLAQMPSGCSLTTAQQLATQRSCSITETDVEIATTTATITTSQTETVSAVTPKDTVLANISSESEILDTGDTVQLLNHLGNETDAAREQNGLVKYGKILNLDKTINEPERLSLNDFIVYGTRSTQRLGAGERAAVINSYYQSYKRLPNSESEWSDALKIASGRWPSERNAAAEAQAKIEFRKVYAREASLKNSVDENAIMVIAYGLIPGQRNLNSEQAAIKTFRWVYGHNPENALAWNIVRAIAYSGAKR